MAHEAPTSKHGHVLSATIMDVLKRTDSISTLQMLAMDGEASNVPRTWMAKVFEALDQHEKVRGKRGQTVSVLGIQSSGKSTLLNSMFGANFSVAILNSYK